MAFETTTELKQYVRDELGHELAADVESSDDSAILSHLDRAHKIVVAGGGILNYNEQNEKVRDNVTFVWARSKFPKILNLETSIESLSCTVTNDSASATLSSSYATSLKDYFIRFADTDEVYRISAHTLGTDALTLDGNYVKTSGTKTCKIFKIVYDLGSSDILSLISPIVTQDGDPNISVLDYQALVEEFPIYSIYKGFPRLAGILKETDGTITIQFSSYPDQLERLEIPYIPIPSTLDEDSVDPIIPKDHRLCIAELTAYHMVFRNDDDRAMVHLQTARIMFKDLVSHNERLLGGADANLGKVFHNYTAVEQGSPPAKTVVKFYD